MKQQWEKFALKLDAMSLRERVMLFAASATVIVFIVYSSLLEPLHVRQKALQSRIGQQQNRIVGVDAEITQKLQAFKLDPDAENRARLQGMRQELERRSAALRAVQQGLVAPEKMVPVLRQILLGNGKLRLLSLKTLPAGGVQPGAPATAGAPANAAPGAAAKPPVKASELLYRHGVEVVLQGGYLDMVSYMAALEALPTQLFWGDARFEVEQYPSARLTLTLYTMSLDQKWMKL
ncbi:hypothetical protein [Janthinobacterium fluminis]|uniref:MSHA biogenesis protein MshJ n=1 Tax=Janthinobacterium fluminis TaxID=2987524 RepID=A0ABT5K667_9BURK|nr:hypothetical protein [Janthinobacterium fluminis]MDC8760394.1 hypothetical protein [Janthinobacterium fluminis]